MKIYLAARYSRRDELRVLRDELVRRGHEVTSRWLETEWSVRDGESSSALPEYRQTYAKIDLDDVSACDAIINFTEAPGSGLGKKGGRHVEFGYAMALGKRMIVVGYRENLFHEHPEVEFYNTVGEMINTAFPAPA